MEIKMEKGYYQLCYDNRIYDHLEFVRMDSICNKVYLTMKHILREEMFTFEQDQLKWIRKKAVLALHSEPTGDRVADSSSL